MRSATYWIGQYLLAAGTMFLLLIAIDLMRGDSFAAVWLHTLAWSGAAAAIFVAARWRQAARAVDGATPR